MQDIDEILDDHLQATVDVDFSVLHGLQVLDEGVNVGLDGLDLFIGEVQKRSQSLEKSVQGGLQISQEAVERSWSLVG